MLEVLNLKAHMKKDGIDIRLDSNARYGDRKFDNDGRLLMHDGDYLTNLDLKRTSIGEVK